MKNIHVSSAQTIYYTLSLALAMLLLVTRTVFSMHAQDHERDLSMQLVHAVSNYDVARVEELLNHEADPNMVIPEGPNTTASARPTLLQYALAHESLARDYDYAFTFLTLVYGVIVYPQITPRDEPRDQHRAIIRLLLEYGAHLPENYSAALAHDREKHESELKPDKYLPVLAKVYKSALIHAILVHDTERFESELRSVTRMGLVAALDCYRRCRMSPAAVLEQALAVAAGQGREEYASLLVAHGARPTETILWRLLVILQRPTLTSEFREQYNKILAKLTPYQQLTALLNQAPQASYLGALPLDLKRLLLLLLIAPCTRLSL
jgi:hypothetical protein